MNKSNDLRYYTTETEPKGSNNIFLRAKIVLINSWDRKIVLYKVQDGFKTTYTEGVPLKEKTQFEDEFITLGMLFSNDKDAVIYMKSNKFKVFFKAASKLSFESNL